MVRHRARLGDEGHAYVFAVGEVFLLAALRGVTWASGEDNRRLGRQTSEVVQVAREQTIRAGFLSRSGVQEIVNARPGDTFRLGFFQR